MKSLLVLALLLLATLCGFSQTRATSELHIYVADPTGAALPNASITISNQQTGLTRGATSNAAGEAVFPNLPLTGTYDVSATATGFASATQSGIHLSADNIAQTRISLALSGENTTITVTGTAQTIEAASAQLSNRFSSEELNDTPVLGRKLSTAALLDSSVRSARGTGDLFLGQTLIVVDGAGRRQTTYSVDDVTGNDTWGRQALFTAIPFSAVQEFEIIRNPISTEFGWTAGSAINIVTRSGTNALHGDFIGLWRPTQIEANNPLSVYKTGDKLAQGSGTLSGPIIKYRTHFLLS
ncbi:MAG: carboxypeptidase regulatory-like domain-containing protein, partial [Acidobacteriaceae bacterium]